MTVQDEIRLVEYCIKLLEEKPKCKIAALELRRHLTTFKLAVQS